MSFTKPPEMMLSMGLGQICAQQIIKQEEVSYTKRRPSTMSPQLHKYLSSCEKQTLSIPWSCSWKHETCLFESKSHRITSAFVPCCPDAHRCPLEETAKHVMKSSCPCKNSCS